MISIPASAGIRKEWRDSGSASDAGTGRRLSEILEFCVRIDAGYDDN